MAHPNEELVRRGYEAFSKGDVDTLRQVFADDTVFHEPGHSPISGDHQGIDQVLGFFGTLAERSGGTFRANLHDIVANDEHAVGIHTSEAEREGRRAHSPTTLVFHVRDGRIAETWSHHYDQHEFDEFWAYLSIQGRPAQGSRSWPRRRRGRTWPAMARASGESKPTPPA